MSTLTSTTFLSSVTASIHGHLTDKNCNKKHHGNEKRGWHGRAEAVRALGLLGLLMATSASIRLPCNSQAAQLAASMLFAALDKDEAPVRMLALQALCDLALSWHVPATYLRCPPASNPAYKFCRGQTPAGGSEVHICRGPVNYLQGAVRYIFVARSEVHTCRG
jgi:hypothetical protein